MKNLNTLTAIAAATATIATGALHASGHSPNLKKDVIAQEIILGEGHGSMDPSQVVLRAGRDCVRAVVIMGDSRDGVNKYVKIGPDQSRSIAIPANFVNYALDTTLSSCSDNGNVIGTGQMLNTVAGNTLTFTKDPDSMGLYTDTTLKNNASEYFGPKGCIVPAIKEGETVAEANTALIESNCLPVKDMYKVGDQKVANYSVNYYPLLPPYGLQATETLKAGSSFASYTEITAVPAK